MEQYLNLQISQVIQIFYEIQRRAPVVYITDSPAKLHKNITETALGPTMIGWGRRDSEREKIKHI